MAVNSQRSFASGEISPSLHSRVDFFKYATGLKTCRNFMVNRHGGVSNRPGTRFVGETKYKTRKTRLIPFIYDEHQTHVLEIGHRYIRIINADGPQLWPAREIFQINQSSPCRIGADGRFPPESSLYVEGAIVYIHGVKGMGEINGRYFEVTNPGGNYFDLKDIDTGEPIDASSYSAYTGGGTVSQVLEIETQYEEDEIFDINFVQHYNKVTLVHRNHPPHELEKQGATSWLFSSIQFQPGTHYPAITQLLESYQGSSGDSHDLRYKVTAIDGETFEESLAGTWGDSGSEIISITASLPPVVTAPGHGFVDGEEITIRYRSNFPDGMIEVNGMSFIVANPTSDTFELMGVDGSSFSEYTGGAEALNPYLEIKDAKMPTSTNPVRFSWDPVPGAREYNIYREVNNGVYGLIGIANGTTFRDVGVPPDTSQSPPVARNPFAGQGNHPGSVMYIQQRLCFGGSESDPQKIWMSKTANFKNFTTRNPIQDDDAVTFSMVGKQVNQIRHLIDLGKCVILTSGGEWSAEGDAAGIIRPTDINLRQHSYNGAGKLPPVIVDGSALYVQARGSIIRDLGFSYQVDGYQGNDLTIFSSHLFSGHSISDWAYQQTPNSIVWVAREDGTLLGLTLVREQQLIAWHRHDFINGKVRSVTTVPTGSEDRLYLIAERKVRGITVQQIEFLETREIHDLRDALFMDSALSFDGRNHDLDHTMEIKASSPGEWSHEDEVLITSNIVFFEMDGSEIGNAIHFEDSEGNDLRCTITEVVHSGLAKAIPSRTVPEELRDVATTTWSKAVDEVGPLWHLEGMAVSVCADGVVVANPNNPKYEKLVVEDGRLPLGRAYSVIHVGLPYISDIETLNIDTAQGETLSNKKMNIQHVTAFLEKSRGMWAGSRPPKNDEIDPLEGLREIKLRDDEGYDSPVNLKTGKVDINIKSQWNNNGRVFIRQVDPLPLSVLSIFPGGYIPYR